MQPAKEIREVEAEIVKKENHNDADNDNGKYCIDCDDADGDMSLNDNGTNLTQEWQL